MNKFKILVAALAVSFVMTSCSPGTPLVEPKFTVLKASDQIIEKAIVESLMDRGWIITGKEDSKITADYAKRGFSVTIAVHYAKNEITIIHEKSDKLRYKEEDGEIYIHPNYNKWIRNLENDIKKYVQQAQFR